MSKRLVVLVLVAAGLLLLAATNYHRLKSIRFRPAVETELFAAQIGHSCERVHEVIGSRLSRAYRGMAAERALTSGSGIDDNAWSDPLGRWAGSADEVAGGKFGREEVSEYEQYELDPELRKYYDLPARERMLDWMLVHSGDAWESEYEYGGRPAPFFAHFVIHLRCDGPSATTVQIYEDSPYVCAGELFGWQTSHGHLFANHSFGFHPDCRRVAPTRIDRADVLKQVQALF